MSYKKNAMNNRDALFGGAAPDKKKGSAAAAPRPAPRSSAGSSNSKPSNKGYSYAAGSSGTAMKSYDRKKKKTNLLSGEAKANKLKEAEDYRKKANKCMQQGLFKKADPLAASTFFKRSADAYQLCGEERLEYLLRMSSGDAQMMIGTYATAAAEYTRAAELVEDSTVDDVNLTLEQKREDASKLHKKASEAWRLMNENSKSAECMINSAMAWMIDDESNDTGNDQPKLMSKRVLTSLEEAVESFVPDILNKNGKYRQTGVSAYIDPKNENESVTNPSEEALSIANNTMVTRAYSHEPLWKVVFLFISYGEYASALYTNGAITTLLSKDGISTLSLSRSFCCETILTLAMGDPIAANENFLNIHLQNNNYLSSRECALAEDLIRAIQSRDIETLNQVRDTENGPHKAGLANLHPNIRELVQNLRISGVARKQKDTSEDRPIKSKKPIDESKSLDELAKQNMGFTKEDEEQAAFIKENQKDPQFDTDALDAELNELNFGDDDDEDSDLDLR